MKRVLSSVLTLCALCAWPAAAYAQERGNVGLVIAMPTDVGVIWHVTDTVAVRPEINFSFGSSELEGLGASAESSRRAYSLETSVLFYAGDVSGVRTYVAPRVGFEWSSLDPQDNDTEISGDSVEVSLSYGAEYAPVARFSIFGELGLEYARATAGLDTGGNIESRTSAWGPRTQVGVILYFGK